MAGGKLHLVLAVAGLVALVAMIGLGSGAVPAQAAEERSPRVKTQEVGFVFRPEVEDEVIVVRSGDRKMSLLLPAVQARLSSLEDEGDDFWDPILPADVKQRMRMDLSFFDEADALFGKVRVSGKTEAQLTRVPTEELFGAYNLTWRGQISGEGRCLDARCVEMELALEMSGKLVDADQDLLNPIGVVRTGQQRGALTLEMRSRFNRQTGAWQIIADEGAPDAIGTIILGVMPGDNVQIEDRSN